MQNNFFNAVAYESKYYVFFKLCFDFRIEMEDEQLQEVLCLSSDLSDEEWPQDLKPLKKKTEKMMSNLKKAVESSRAAADKLDEVWAKYKLAHASGTSAGILGGLLTVGGGIATLMSAGAATPLLFAGVTFGLVGAGTNITAKIIESLRNSNEIAKANGDMKVALDSVAEVKNLFKDLSEKGDKSSLSFILKLAGKSVNPIWKVVAAYLSYSGGAKAASKVGRQAAREGLKEGAKKTGDDLVQAGGQLTGKVIIVFSAVMLVWDTIDLSFTIYDLVMNKKSEAAKELRKKADELEMLYK